MRCSTASATANSPVVELLDQLLGAELSARRERSITMRLKIAGLPGIKTIDQFDFGFQPSLDEGKARDLHTLRIPGNRQNVIFLGPPGCGKTHLSTSLGHAAITAGEMVHFTTARELFAKLRLRSGLHFTGSPLTAQSCSSSTRSAMNRSIMRLPATSSDSSASGTGTGRSF